MSTATANGIASLLLRAAAIPGWADLQRLAEELLTVEKLVEFYRKLDSTYPPVVAGSVATQLANFRKFVRDYLVADARFPKSSRLSNPYRSNLRIKESSRGTISDLVDKNSEIPQPISALPHSSHQELLETSLKKRKGIIDKLSDVTATQFKRFRENRDWFAALENADFTQEERFTVETGIISREINRGTKSRFYSAVTTLSLETRLGASFDAIRKGYTHQHPCTREEIGLLDFSSLQTIIDKKVPGMPKGIWVAFYYPQIGDHITLYACVLRLQIKTAWNIDAVLSLRATDIEPVAAGVFIQSLKNKTDDHTPPCLIPHEDHETIFAINFLIERAACLSSLGIPPEDGNLFSGGLYVQETFTLTHAKEKFQKLYDLPPFSSEQVRGEILAFVAASKGPKAAAELAGHADLNSISTYTEDREKHAMNAAANLQFQRLLEADIRSSIADAVGDWPSITRIGDGASCRDSTLPPDIDWLEGEVCNAKHCHDGQGCVNREIVVSQETMTELAATVEYYEISWKRQISANPAKFKKDHFPRILFIKALEKVLVTSSYSATYLSIKKAAKTICQ